MKQNDYLLNAISNQDFTNEDFALIGITSENTSLESKNTYKNLDYIRDHELFQTNGIFDEQKFDSIYDALSIGYQELATIDAAKSLGEKLATSQYNIFGDQEKINPTGQFIIQKTLHNPLRNKSSIWGANIITEGPLSVREIAQTQLTDNEGIYEDSPNETGFFGDFFDTKVLATYDSDGTHVDPTTGLVVEHKKGDYKYNHNGTFYYESLGDRDIYGKQVLSKFDVITTDGSVYNKYDFFDSDDKEKSLAGTLAKTVIKVAPAFIPYVGPWYIAARIGMNTVDIGTKIGKMIAGPDSPNLSAIEGFVASLGTSVSDYAQEHLWSAENILNMAGDVFLQLAEQRWLFSHLPSLLKGNKLGFDEAAREVWKQKRVKDYIKQYKIKAPKDSKDVLMENYNILGKAVGETNKALADILQDNYKLGEHISRAYMTAVTSASTYGEAIDAGASNLEATLFSLGFAFGENLILRTKLGDWMLPELRLEKARLQKVIKTLVGDIKKPAANATKEQKLNWVKRWIKAGSNWFKEAGVDQSTGKTLGKHMISNSLGEGFEETVEQAWLDMSRSIFNFTDSLLGGDTYLRPTWRDKEGNLNLLNTLNDYALNFVGGVIGGGLGNIHLSFNEAKNITALNSDVSAYQELLYHIREGRAQDIIKIGKKMQLSNPNLGIKLDGSTLSEATESDNQDVSAKNVFEYYINTLEKLVQMDKNVKSDSDISLDLLYKDLRFSKLLESPVLKSYLQNYNTAVANMTETSLAIAGLVEPKASSEKLNDTEEKQLKQLEDTLKEQQKKVEEYTDGTQAFYFIKDAIWSMDSGLSEGYMPTNVLQHIEFREAALDHTRKLSEIPKPELEQYIKEWESGTFDYNDRLREKRKWFDRVNEKISGYLNGHISTYLQDINTLLNNVETINQITVNNRINSRQSEQDINDFLNTLYSNKGYDSDFSKRIVFLENFLSKYASVDHVFQYYFEVFKIIRATESEEALESAIDNWAKEGNVVRRRQILNDLLDTINMNTLDDGIGLNEVVSVHQDLFDLFVKDMFSDSNVVDYLNTDVSTTPYLSYTSREFLKNFYDDYMIPEDAQKSIETIDRIPYTPIAQYIDSVQLVLNDDSIKFSTLIEALESQAYTLSQTGTLSEFGFPDVTWEQAMTHANDLLSIASSHLVAGRSDLNDPLSPFGYNYTVNYLQKNQDLVTFTRDGFNVLQNDLNKLRNELRVYKSLVRNSASQLLNSQYPIAVNFINQLTTALHNTFFGLSVDPEKPEEVQQLENWTGIAEFKETISQLKDSMNGLINVDGIFTTEQKKYYADVKLQLDTAIYTFMQANKSKSQEEFADLFLALFPVTRTGYLIKPKQDLFQKNATVHLKTIFSYLASAGSLNSVDFINAYKQILETESKFIHTEALQNILFHEVSFVTQKELWNKLTYAYNAVQQRDLNHGTNDRGVVQSLIMNEAGFANVPTEKKNTSSALTFEDCLLATGLAGTGKTTANITLLLKIINNISNLTNKIAIVHKTLKQAEQVIDDLVKLTGLNKSNFAAFTHESYIKHINPEITPISAENPVVNEDELVQNEEDKTWHYKKEKDLNQDATKFSLVIYDEVTNVSYLDLNVHQAYLTAHNIRSICLGDFNQSTLSGKFGIDEQLQLHAHNFFATLGLYTSFRSDNKVNTDSQLNFLQGTDNILNDKRQNPTESNYQGYGITTHYLLNDEEFNGIMAVDPNQVSDDFKNAVNIMLKSASQGQIFVICDDIQQDISPLYKYLKSLPDQSKFTYKETVAQGQETDYAIIISQPVLVGEEYEFDTLQPAFQDLYTSISRARQGSIITNIAFPSRNGQLFHKSIKHEDTVKSVLTPEIVKDFNNVAVEIFNELLKNKEIKPITLDYSITVPEVQPATDIDTIKKEIDEFKNEAQQWENEGLILPLDPDTYNRWLKAAKDANDEDLIKVIEALANHVNYHNSNDGETYDDVDSVPYENKDPEKITAPLYTFNSYLAGIDRELSIIIGGLTNFTKETERDPLNWKSSLVGFRGILKKLAEQSKDIKQYYNSSTGKVTLEAVSELHKLYYQIYNGLHINSPFVSNDDRVILGFVNQNSNNTERGSISPLQSENTPAFKGTNHRISALILDSKGDVKVEIPLFTLPNILSLLDSYKGVGNVDDNLIQQINNAKKVKDTQTVNQLINSINVPILQTLYSIYTTNINKVVYFTQDDQNQFQATTDSSNASDITTMMNLIYNIEGIQKFGIQVLSKQKGENGVWEYNPKPILLQDWVNYKPNQGVNNIYTYPKVFAFDTDVQLQIRATGDVDNESNYELQTIPKGKQFIIVSQDPDITNLDIDFDALLDRIQNGDANIIYVNAPVINTSDDNFETLITEILNDLPKKEFKLYSRSTILSIATVLSEVLENTNIDELSLQSKQKGKVNKYIDALKKILPKLSSDIKQWDNTAEQKLQLITGNRGYNLSLGQVLVTSLKCLINNLDINRNNNPIKQKLIEGLKTQEQLYFPFARVGDKKFSERGGYYELNVTFGNDQIYSNVQLSSNMGNIRLPLYTNGELRTLAFLGDITSILTSINNGLNSVSIEPDPVKPKYYKATRINNLYKEEIGDVVRYFYLHETNEKRVGYYIQLQEGHDFQFNTRSTQLTDIEFTENNDEFLGLHESVDLSKTPVYKQLYISIKYPGYVKNGEIYEYQNAMYIFQDDSWSMSELVENQVAIDAKEFAADFIAIMQQDVENQNDSKKDFITKYNINEELLEGLIKDKQNELSFDFLDKLSEYIKDENTVDFITLQIFPDMC